MCEKDLNTLAIFSLGLAILTDFIALFIALNLQKRNQQKKQTDKKTKADIQELQHEIILLKLEIEEMR